MASPGTATPPFTPQQLDDLYSMLAPGLDGAHADRSSRRSTVDGGSVRRQTLFLQVVDRAIAELASSRGRRRLARR